MTQLINPPEPKLTSMSSCVSLSCLRRKGVGEWGEGKVNKNRAEKMVNWGKREDIQSLGWTSL